MSDGTMTAVAGGSGDNLQESTVQKIGKAAATLDNLAEQLKSRVDADEDWKASVRKDMDAQAQILTGLKDQHDRETAEAGKKARDAEISSLIDWSKGVREPSKARLIGSGTQLAPSLGGYSKGSFIFGVHEARQTDYDAQRKGKDALGQLAEQFKARGDYGSDSGEHDEFKAVQFEESWGKATLGTTDATGGWVIPNAIVDEFIAPAAITNIYRQLMTTVNGVTASAVDIPFRSAVRTRAAIAGFGATKENLDLAYNGYTATMYTLARIYDIGNQFLRQSRGAAEADVLSELAAAFAQGESFYIREGTGTSQPFGYTSALTNGPAAFRSTFSSPSDSTVAGSIAASIAVASGALAGRGVTPTAAVLSATSYWNMLRQGSDSAGFWFATQERSPATIRPGTLISPFGIPVYPDADADLEGTAAVIDNLVVADWRRFKLYFGDSYRVDSSDQAGTRWDTNLTGFRGEEEMGFDGRPAVYAGYAQMITDIVP